MQRFSFSVPGEPVGKGRPRFGGGRTYTPKRTAAYERAVASAFRGAYPDAEPIPAGVPILAMICARFAPPKSASRARREGMLTGKIRCVKRPDLDNIAKAVLDALNGLAYADDAQIIQMQIEKQYSDAPGAAIILRALGGTDHDD